MSQRDRIVGVISGLLMVIGVLVVRIDHYILFLAIAAIVLAAVIALIFANPPLAGILLYLAWIGALAGGGLVVINTIQTFRSGVCSSH